MDVQSSKLAAMSVCTSTDQKICFHKLQTCQSNTLQATCWLHVFGFLVVT